MCDTLPTPLECHVLFEWPLKQSDSINYIMTMTDSFDLLIIVLWDICNVMILTSH
jgi:hypothetical protein